MDAQNDRGEFGSLIANQERQYRRCVAVEEHLRLLRKDPQYRWRRRMIEQEMREWIRRYAAAGLRTGLIRIPVVVHVIYNTAAQNISNAQIQSQIAVLNADFRRLNADAGATPGAFAGIAADARLEFALAVRDPNCQPTTGITRTASPVAGWTYPSDDMKSAATGGHDPWDVNKYLNIWVVNYTDGTLGYGTFPGMPANIQGVVCHVEAFGTTGSLITHAAGGRTMTHEIGHWLDLHHIWGDDGSACTGSDLVVDTPNQAGASPFGPCRAFPSGSCSNGPNGDMFMNYMDYSADECMNMFTAGQVVRMDAALHTTRASIIASDGLVPAAGSPGPDLWMQDASDDTGSEPDPSSQPMWISNDIWVRRTNDGLANQDHENPEYRPPGAASNFVYVRVRNRGCSGNATGTLKLYWAKASSGLSWPAPWDGSVIAPALMGGIIGTQPVSVAAGDDTILIFSWMPPNPADYTMFGADQAHFCLLARIETTATAPFGMTIPETTDLYANVQNNNNIVWKNITVVDEVPGFGRIGSVLVANFEREVRRTELVFLAGRRDKSSIFEWGQVFVQLPLELIKQLDDQTGEQSGLRRFDDTTFQVLRSGARLGSFELRPGEIYGVRVRFIPLQQQVLGVRVFTLDLVQTANERAIGGQRFVLKNTPDPRLLTVENPSSILDGDTWITGGTPSNNPCDCGCN
jgi:hypothetical protein